MKTFEQNFAQCKSEIQRSRGEIVLREQKLAAIMPILQGYADQIELMGFELTGSMLEIRAKRLSTAFMEKIEGIVCGKKYGKLVACEDDLGVFECGLAGQLWVQFKWFPELISDNQLSFVFMEDKSE